MASVTDSEYPRRGRTNLRLPTTASLYQARALAKLDDYGTPAFQARTLATDYGTPAFQARTLATRLRRPFQARKLVTSTAIDATTAPCSGPSEALRQSNNDNGTPGPVGSRQFNRVPGLAHNNQQQLLDEGPEPIGVETSDSPEFTFNACYVKRHRRFIGVCPPTFQPPHERAADPAGLVN
ncbi:hypothetical protein THAOC_19508 [Thalassiosira oceanica]|uniref:Uncharacterized protein n=1 Tax=Thalassiosira oceanica TaxID=159749 RepID=K0S2E2_THAOC|nr:hypothetical protein THAOC_19508 [Thalassiosira oceanica]|eukprot:EJK60188.1 hypothetical protein THAOC_19508 [Thalassiosira oceanica]